MLLPQPLRSNHAEMQPLNAGGGDGCTGGETALCDAIGGDRIVVVIVDVEVVSTVETVVVVIVVGVVW